jgi:hypothetical protein
MRARTIVIGMVVLVPVLVGIAVYSGHVASIHTAGGASPSAEAPVRGLTVTDPQVSVEPSDSLTDGQSVIVRVTGFGIGSEVRVSECASASAANDRGCGAELAAQTLLFTRESRAGSAAFTVRSEAPAGPLTTGAIEACPNQCVIVATLGSGFAFAYTGIAFQGP